MIKGIHHVAISTADMERALAFYQDLLGFEKIMDFDWGPSVPDWPNDQMDMINQSKDCAGRLVMLKAGNAYLEIFQYQSPTPNPQDPDRPVSDHGITHICLNVTDVESEYQRLKAAGMKFHAPLLVFDDGAICTTYGRDPDGNVIEIQEVRNKNHSIHMDIK